MINRFIFCDLDNTLVCKVRKVLVDKFKNRFINCGLDVKDLGDYFVFMRPYVNEFLNNLNKIGQVYILSHSSQEYINKTIDVFKFQVSGGHSTEKLERGALRTRYALDKNKWVLIDNMNIGDVELDIKFDLLGDRNFINIKSWVVNNDINNYDLLNTIDLVKKKFKIKNA